MQLSIRTDRALRLLLYLDAQDRGRFVTMAECGEALAEAATAIKSIISALVQAKIIEAKPGPQGGLRLVRAAEALRVSEIVAVTDESASVGFLRCENGKRCNCFMAGHCGLKPMYEALHDRVMRCFEEYRLCDLRRPTNTDAAIAFAETYLKRVQEVEVETQAS